MWCVLMAAKISIEELFLLPYFEWGKIGSSFSLSVQFVLIEDPTKIFHERQTYSFVIVMIIVENAITIAINGS